MLNRSGRWWLHPMVPLSLLLLCAVPLLYPAIPPLLDVPGHMGRYHVSINLASSPYLHQFYDYNWALIGNLGVDLLVVPLGSVLGVELATKIIVIAIPLLMGAGFLWAAQQVHGHVPPTALLALVFTYAYPFHYGFVNYCLAVAFAAIGFAAWIRLHGSAVLLRVVIFILVSAVVWLAHAVGWVVLCVLCGGYELWRQWSERRRWLLVLQRTALRVLPLLSPLVLIAMAPRGAPVEFAGWLDPSSLAKWVLALNRDRWLTYDVACTLTNLGILAIAAFRRCGLSLQPALAAPAFALAVLYLLAPDSINGSAFVGARLVPYAAAYALLAISLDRATAIVARRWAIFCIAFVGLRIAMTTASFIFYDASYQRNLRALEAVPAGSTIAVLSRQNCRSTLSNWGNARLQHLGGIAIIRRDAFVNDQWDAAALQLLRVRYSAAAPFIASPSEWVSLERCPAPLPRYLPDALEQLPKDAFDYVWLLDIPPPYQPERSWLRPVYRTPEGAMYKVME